MHSSPLAATNSPHAPTDASHQSSRRADRAYQGLTIAVMVLLLGSLLMIW
jgi:hypothetical protein